MNVESVLKEKAELTKRMKKLDAFIAAAQEICIHKWVDDGHDSHHSYQRCVLCTLQERN